MVGSNLFAIPDSLIYKIKDKGDGFNVSMNGTNLTITQGRENFKYWLYTTSDLYKFALKNFDDSKWKNVSSDFELDETDSTFKGICWMRLHYKVEKGFVGKTFMLRMGHFGASEIFNDGKFLISFGKVSANPKEEISQNANNTYFPLEINDTLEHILSVRYSNADFKRYYKSFKEEEVGFSLRFFRFDDMLEIQELSEYLRVFFIGLSLFLLALSLVHLMIYLFETSRKFNLYHSLFVGTLSLLFLISVLEGLIESPLSSFRLTYYGGVLKPLLFISALTLLYNLFQKKLNKFYYISFSVFILCLVFRYVFNEYYNAFYVSMFFMMYIGCTSISIKAIRQNFRGAKIVGLGVLGVTVFLILAILSLVLLNDNGLIPSIIFVIFAILSLPLSMSVYLAFDFAKANKTLTEQIIQIEDLSAQALKDEKEKKQILENQNQMLEEQVKVRTAEIREQKEVIEEKNKDITDSINYAKRIQDVILTAKEVKYRLFPDAFVLFKPKDIVSGDFYWFTEKNGIKLIAACDCTGHGVPGALMSMVGNNVLNQIVNERAITLPDEILTELDKQVRKTLKQDENADTKDGMDLALLSFSGEYEVEYAGANRPLWIITNNSLNEIKATKVSIGGQQYENQAAFKGHKVSLSKGDTIYIFSDGYADQFNNEDKKLMSRRFKEILLSIQNLSMSEQEKYLDDFIEKWKGGLEQTDDILVIGIRV